jgi:outer membrane biogenesis lipoprotein LolB
MMTRKLSLLIAVALFLLSACGDDCHKREVAHCEGEGFTTAQCDELARRTCD